MDAMCMKSSGYKHMYNYIIVIKVLIFLLFVATSPSSLHLGIDSQTVWKVCKRI